MYISIRLTLCLFDASIFTFRIINSTTPPSFQAYCEGARIDAVTFNLVRSSLGRMTPKYIFQVQNLSIHYQYPGKCHGFGWLWIITGSHCRLIHHWDSPVYDNKQVNPFSRVNFKIPPPPCSLLSRAKPRVFMKWFHLFISTWKQGLCANPLKASCEKCN